MTQSQKIMARLKRHAELMAGYEAQGISRDEASKRALADIEGRTTTTYMGYILVTRDGDRQIAVYDSRFPDTVVFRTTAQSSAKNWVRAYRDGVQWAVDARLKETNS
jgi:hypothetical protein